IAFSAGSTKLILLSVEPALASYLIHSSAGSLIAPAGRVDGSSVRASALVAGLFMRGRMAGMNHKPRNQRPRISRILKALTIICAVLVIVPILVFIATHNMYPGSTPGGFGEGYENMVDLLLYGIVVMPALSGFLLGAT